jgi:hypothetical protein
VPPANPRPDANASAVCPLDRHAETRFAHVDAFAIGHTIAPPSQAARTVAVQRLRQPDGSTANYRRFNPP